MEMRLRWGYLFFGSAKLVSAQALPFAILPEAWGLQRLRGARTNTSAILQQCVQNQHHRLLLFHHQPLLYNPLLPQLFHLLTNALTNIQQANPTFYTESQT
jgi:hypothetical protein